MHPELERRRQVEEYFARSGRTYRKSALRLWFDEEVKSAIIRAGLTAVGLWARGKRNALAPRVREIEFTLPGLPAAFDGYTILQISDLHIDKIDGLAERLAFILDRLRPDLCVLTGDYRYEIRGSCAEVYPRMRTVLAAVHAHDGVFGILGNHDAAEIAEHVSGMGVRMLINEAAAIRRGAEEIWIAGVDDQFDYRRADLDLALRNISPNAFTVLLAHSPCLYKQAEERGIRLYLCGHTHAGQIRLPGIGAIRKNGDFPRAYAQDSWVYNNLHAYTSWGAGCSTLPVRYNCPPEVALIRLRAE